MHSSFNRTPFGVASLGGVLRAVWESPLWATPLRHTTATSVHAWYAPSRVTITAITVHVQLRNGPEITSLVDGGPDAQAHAMGRRGELG